MSSHPLSMPENSTLLSAKRLSIDLPWAPSVNHYWKTTSRRGRPIVLLTEAGERYRTEVAISVVQQRVPRGALTGRLALSIEAYPPDRRCRDIDNLFKGILDGLKHAAVLRDDGDIDELSIRRLHTEPHGRIHVAIWEIDHTACVDKV